MNTQVIRLFYLSKPSYGGWVTYTVHLMKALREVGVTPLLHKITARSESNGRDFGYGEQYRNVSLEDALKSQIETPIILVATDKNFAHEAAELISNKGAWAVIHDPTELKHDHVYEHLDQEKCIVIRESMKKYIEDAHFIPHPFVRYCVKSDGVLTEKHREKWRKEQRKHRGITISRLDFDKHSDIIFKANELVAPEHRVEIRGCETRIYTHNKLAPNFDAFRQDSDRADHEKMRFDKVWGSAQELCMTADFMVDMSAIKGDGGGTQYTFLEAIDAGTVCVLNREWTKVTAQGQGCMVENENCLAVSNAEELAKLLQSNEKHEEIAAKATELLKTHDPQVIGNRYKELFFPVSTP